MNYFPLIQDLLTQLKSLQIIHQQILLYKNVYSTMNNACNDLVMSTYIFWWPVVVLVPCFNLDQELGQEGALKIERSTYYMYWVVTTILLHLLCTLWHKEYKQLREEITVKHMYHKINSDQIFTCFCVRIKVPSFFSYVQNSWDHGLYPTRHTTVC